MNQIAASVFLAIFSTTGIVYSQERSIQFIDIYDPANEVILKSNVIGILMNAANKSTIGSLKFVEYGRPARSVNIGSITIGEPDPEIPDWDPGQSYYWGDVVLMDGLQYEANSDLDPGHEPGRSGDWTATSSILNNQDLISKIGVEFAGSEPDASSILYLHFYYDGEGEGSWYDGMSNYLFSLEGREVFEFFDKNGFVTAQAGINNNTVGSLFLDPPSSVVSEFLEKNKITNGQTAMEYEYAVARNLGKNSDELWFLRETDGAAWRATRDDIPGAGSGTIHRMGKTFYSESLITFMDMSPITVNSPETFPEAQSEDSEPELFTCRIVERLSPLAYYLVRNQNDEPSTIYLDEVSQEDWTGFVESLNANVKAGKFKAYASEDLEQPVSSKEANSRLKLYETEESEFYDKWSVGTNYFEGDLVEVTGVSYKSTRDNNKGRMPNQYPEYWELHLDEVAYYGADEISLLFVASNIEFDRTGKVRSIIPKAVSLGIPGEYAPDGATKIIAWISIESVRNIPGISRSFLEKISNHDFNAEPFYHSSIRAKR